LTVVSNTYFPFYFEKIFTLAVEWVAVMICVKLI
jgi:hypothetical protein